MCCSHKDTIASLQHKRSDSMQDVRWVFVFKPCKPKQARRVQVGCDFTDVLKEIMWRGEKKVRDIRLVAHVWAWAMVTFIQTINGVRQQPVCCDSGKLSSLFPFLEDIFRSCERRNVLCLFHVEFLKKPLFPLCASEVHLREALHRLLHLPLRKYSLGCGWHFLFGLQLPTFKCVLLYRIVFLFCWILLHVRSTEE